MKFDSAKRSQSCINKTQVFCFQVFLHLYQAIGISVNTNMHRLMRLISHHFTRFGCSRRGDTDLNESMHKRTKSAYNGNNHKFDAMGSQFLNVSFSNDKNGAKNLIYINGTDSISNLTTQFISSCLF